MGKKLTLEDVAEDREVVLSDGSGLDLKFKVVPLTRKRKREVAGAFAKVRELGEGQDDLVIDAEREDEQMRALCDVVNAALNPAQRPGSDEPVQAGDLLYDRWEGEEITEDAVMSLVLQLVGQSNGDGAAADPT